jgi:hypothetical protein
MLEPSLLLPQCWEEGGLVGGCRVVADSSAVCPCRRFLVSSGRTAELVLKK